MIYEIEKMTEVQIVNLLITIEEQKLTGFIKIEAAKESLKRLDEERKRKELKKFISESGFTHEELLKYLEETKQNEDVKGVKVVKLSSEQQEVLESNLYNDSLSRLKDKYSKK